MAEREGNIVNIDNNREDGYEDERDYVTERSNDEKFAIALEFINSQPETQGESSSMQLNPLEQPSTFGCFSFDREKIYEGMTSCTETPNYKHELREVPMFSPEVRGEAKNATSPINYWSLFITDAIIDQIVNHTNTALRPKKGNYYYETTQLEIKALIGLYYMRGLLQCSIEECYLIKDIFEVTMHLSRFKTLTGSLSFGETEKGTERNEYVELREITEIWKTFIENCKRYYSPSKNCTIGTQLLKYAANSQLRYYTFLSGLKFIIMNDARTGYMINALWHTHQDFANIYKKNTGCYVRELSREIYGSKRNITVGDWFTSVSIVDEMLSKHSLTMIGTIKEENAKMLQGVDEEFKRTRPSDEALFSYDTNCKKVFVKYAPIEDVILVLSSNQYYNEDIKTTIYNADIKTAKSKIIATYNETKEGTKMFNDSCYEYTVSSQATRTPLRVFYAVLDQAGVNSLILYNLNNSNEPFHEQESFLQKLSASLIQPYLDIMYHEGILTSPVVVDGI